MAVTVVVTADTGAGATSLPVQSTTGFIGEGWTAVTTSAITTTTTTTSGVTTVNVAPISRPLPAGTILIFTDGAGNVIVVTTTASTPAGATTLSIQPAAGTFGSGATATWPRQPLDIVDRKRVSVVMPDPTIGADGRAVQPWTPTANISAWGRLQAVVDGVDVTFWRDKISVIESWSSAEPFGDAAASINFPQVTIHDTLGPGGTVPWARDWANVEINRIHPDGVTTTPLWEGLISTLEDSCTQTEQGLRIQAMGALLQIGLFRRAPGDSDAPIDIGILIPFQINPTTRQSYRGVQAQSVITGIETTYRGSGEPVTDFILRLLASAVTGGGDQWTIWHDFGRIARLAIKDRTNIHYTVTAGQPGFAARAARDLPSTWNTAYGEFTNTAGIRQRNAFIHPAGGLWHQPWDYALVVHGTDVIGGQLVADNSRVDPSIPRVETWIDGGQGVRAATFQALLAAERARTTPAPRAGEATLFTDPWECSLLEMRAGRNLSVRAMRGGNRTLHLSSVQINAGSGFPSAQVTYDAGYRDYPTVAALLERNRSLVKNPIPVLLRGHDATARAARQIPWDDAASGYVPYERARIDAGATVACPANAWSPPVKWLAAEAETIDYSVLQLNAARPFAALVSSAPIDVSLLPPNPFADNAWDDYTSAGDSKLVGYLTHWGNFGQRGGFYPGLDFDGDPPTGLLIDGGTWQITHENVPEEVRQPPFCWITFWVEGGTADAIATFRRGVGY